MEIEKTSTSATGKKQVVGKRPQRNEAEHAADRPRALSADRDAEDVSEKFSFRFHPKTIAIIS